MEQLKSRKIWRNWVLVDWVSGGRSTEVIQHVKIVLVIIQTVEVGNGAYEAARKSVL